MSLNVSAGTLDKERQTKRRRRVTRKQGGDATNTSYDKDSTSHLNMSRRPFCEDASERICYSKNSREVLHCLTLTVDNKLWVKYQPPGNLAPFLSVYDTKGELLGRCIEESVKGTSLTCLGDTLLSPLTWRWVDPDGKSGNLDLTPNDWALCSKSLPPHIALRTSVTFSFSFPFLLSRQVALSVHCLQQQCGDPPAAALTPVITEGLAFPREPTAFDISGDGRWLAFVVNGAIEAFYTRTECKAAKGFSKSSVRACVEDVAFVVKDRELVLAASSKDCVMIYDFQDGFIELSCLHYVSLFGHSSCLAAHSDGKIWLESTRGHISVRDVSDTELCFACMYFKFKI